jgi:hypothetical protein
MSSDTQTPPAAGHQIPDDHTFALRIPAYAALTSAERDQVDDDPTAEWPVHVRFESVTAALKALRSDGPTSEVVAVSVVEFAVRWSYSKREIETRIRRGLPLVGEGRARRVPLTEGDAWMREQGESPVIRRARAAARRAARGT